ncbi:MAG: ABC transporter permease [Mesorhizobium sp.]|nr:ABC transporter permease [Mesorhizobium sp.]MBN9243780.1 ABC transporter permease [Mesorhizobium sp.]
MASAEEIARAADRKDIRDRWLLSAPALIIILVAATGPLLIVLVYSFLTSAAYGGVEWKFSPEAWVSVFLERDIFDDTLSLADANITIFWRSIKLALMTTVVTLALGFPTAYFMATRSEKTRDLWLFLITIPFWTNLLIRTFAVLQIIRNEGIINTLLMKAGIISAPIQILFTDTAILIGMAYVYLPLMVLPIYASMEKLDFRLVEAGYDLYASRWQVLRRIILPLVKPGVIAGSILVFIPAIGAYVTPSILGGGKNMMISNFIELQFGQAHNWPLGSALAITVMVIVMIALLVYVRNTGAASGERRG